MTENPFGAVHAKQAADKHLKEIVEHYIDFYASGSSHTARAKKLDLHHFMNFLVRDRGFQSQTDLLVKHWDYSSVQRFVEECLTAGEAPATVSRRLATLKHMGRTLSEKIAGFINPAKEVKAPKVNVLRPKGLMEDEIEVIRSRATERVKEKDSFIRKRNLTIFNFLLDTGLRAEEIRLLRMSQLDEKREWIKNVRTKGRRFRNVYITTHMRNELVEYLELRKVFLKKFYPTLTQSQDDSLPLFVSNYDCVPGDPESFFMGAKTLWRAVRELSCDTKLHPHLLRHSYALDLLEDSSDIRLVAQALGHSDVRVTMRYTERRDEEVAAALESSRKK